MGEKDVSTADEYKTWFALILEWTIITSLTWRKTKKDGCSTTAYLLHQIKWSLQQLQRSLCNMDGL